MKNKHLAFLFAGLGLCAVSFGLIVDRYQSPKPVEAASKTYEFDSDGFLTFGSFPTDYDASATASFDENPGSYFASATEVGGSGDFAWYEMKGKKYGVQMACRATSSTDSYFLHGDGKTIPSSRNGKTTIFAFKDLKWVEYDSGKDYVDLISSEILFRKEFNNSGNSNNNLEFVDSGLCTTLNTDFLDVALSDEERGYLQPIKLEGAQGEVKICLPELNKVRSNSSEPKSERASDYAILNQLSSVKGYDHAPYWTMTASGSNRKEVRWYNSDVTACLLSDDEIGVRPVIRLKASMVKSGGASSKSASQGGSVDAGLVLALIFGPIGIGCLVTFLVLWSKKLKGNPSYRAPGWYYAIIFVSVAFCIVSVISFSTFSAGGGGIGGAGSFKYGYYVQSTAQYSGGGIAQVGYNAWLIKSDGTCAFNGAIEDKDNASDFTPVLNGTYTWSGSSITCSVSGYYSGTYTFTVKGGDKLYYNGSEAYHWVRGE